METTKQDEIIDIAKSVEIFEDPESAREWFELIKESPAEMERVMKSTERVFGKTMIKENQKKLDNLTEEIKDLNGRIDAKTRETNQR